MRYSAEICPYCGVAFGEDDDVVVCPECGSPHHRACWRAHGDCANAGKHTEGYVWQKADPAEPEKEQEPEKSRESSAEKELNIICPDCGKACPNGTLRCPECGALLVPFSPMGGEPPVAQFVPGFDPDEQIGRLKSGDIALYCRVSGARYIKAFRKLGEKKKLSWNWGAAFFAPYWFFYRKLYKAGAIFIALFVALGLWMLPVSNAFFDEYDAVYYESQHLYEEEGQAAAEEFLMECAPRIQAAMQPMLLPIAVQLLLHIVAALVADRLYFKKARTDILQVKSTKQDLRGVQLELFKKGGTSVVGTLLSYVGYEAVIYAASWLMNR